GLPRVHHQPHQGAAGPRPQHRRGRLAGHPPHRRHRHERRDHHGRGLRDLRDAEHHHDEAARRGARPRGPDRRDDYPRRAAAERDEAARRVELVHAAVARVGTQPDAGEARAAAPDRALMRKPPFVVEPWSVRETALDLEALSQTESVFALANGHIGLRGNLDEGEPFGIPGTYLNSFYELRPLPYAEAAYGDPELGQSIVNATDGKIIRLLVDDEPLDLRYGQVLAHERVLDLRAGVLRRTTEWRSPAGAEVRVSSTRLVSLAQRNVAAILYELEPLAAPVRVVVQSELVANEPGADPRLDPRAGAALDAPLRSEGFAEHDARVVLLHSTKRSGLRLAAGMDHIVDGPPGTDVAADSAPDVGRVTVATELAPGSVLRVVKLIAYAWSSRRSLPALRDEVVAALAEARHTGWEGLVEAQRAYLDDFWAGADVEIDGDTELQQALRFCVF